jgi:hypothetical protein
MTAARFMAPAPMRASPPCYWMNEVGGVLRPAVLAYLGGTASGHLTLSAEHIAALRAYLRQWIGATAWDQNPHAGAEEKAWLAEMRADVDKLVSRAAIAAWLDRATDGGLDPL